MMFPGVIAAICLTAIMSAIMSTVAALLMMTGTVLSVDVYKRWLKPDATDKQLLIASRAMIFLVAIVGITIAIIQPPGIFGLVIFAFGVMACAFLPSYVCAIYWKKANATGSMVSMVLGAVTNVVWTAAELETVTMMHPFFIGVIVSCLAMFIFSHFGKPTSKEMEANIDHAKGKRIAPLKVEAAVKKGGSSEAHAVLQHLNSLSYQTAKGFAY
jgi:sodium/proline symporter